MAAGVSACGEAEALAKPRPATTGDVDPDIHAREVGARLREARIARGHNLTGLARELRIRDAWLEAIEEGRLDELPGATFETGFVRSYANRLGLDGSALVAHLQSARRGSRPGGLLLAGERHLSRRRVLALFAILALAAGGGWYLMADDGVPVDRMVPIPELPMGSEKTGPAAEEKSDVTPWFGSATPGRSAVTDAATLDGSASRVRTRSQASGSEPAGTSLRLPAAGQRTAERIRAVQSALARLGYDPGRVDGAIGARTRAAIRAFQAASGLVADGKLTPDLERKIRFAAAATGS